MERPLELEDVQFLIKNASRLFPPDPSSITGPGVRQAVWSLQDELIAEREVYAKRREPCASCFCFLYGMDLLFYYRNTDVIIFGNTL